MPVFALYNLNDPSTTAIDSAVDNGAQNGTYINGASSVGGRAVLDGVDDIVKIGNDPAFQLARGTLEIQFSLDDCTTLTEPRTILSRDSEGETEGGFRIETLPNGAIRISHESATGTTVYETAPGFQNAGDEIKVTYSWDATGPGGHVQIGNLTTGDTFNDTVPGTLTMDMGQINQNWIIGAGQDNSPAGTLRHIGEHYTGSVEYFSISDSVDNAPAGPDGIVEGTTGGDLIDVAYTGDPNGDMIDNNDALLPGQAPQDDIVYAYGGDDTVLAGEGNDLVYGGDGDDVLYGGPGNDTLKGEADNDTLYGEDGDDALFGGDGDDVIYGGTGNDLLVGDAGEDTLIGGDGSDTLFGGLGNDLIHLGDPVTGAPDSYADKAFGGADRDTFTGVGVGDSVFGGSEGDDWDTLDLRGTGPRVVVRTNVDSDGNGFDGYVNYLDGDGNVIGRSEFTNIENIICFTPGTLIATPKGEVLVEQLRVGDKVITRDNGIQEIRWMGAREMGWHDFARNPHLRPIMIKTGSLGNGLPERDMMLSPNHRLLVANDRTALYFDEHEVLVAAKHLIGGRGVHQVESVGTTYFHFMFDQHEVVLSNGAWTESFQPGDFSLKGLGNAQRNELMELFPDLKAPAGVEAYQAARKTLKKHEASLLVR